MKFYKITNEDEVHNLIQYKTGLNINITPFRPYGDCESGGIYFTREDILYFLDCGPWIREVTLPEGEEVYENPGKPKKWKSHRVILGERRKIDLEVIKELIGEGADVHHDEALIWASKYGHLNVLKFLVERGANIHNNLLGIASRNGKIEVVKYLVKNGADVHAKDDEALIWASLGGHNNVVKYLVKNGSDVQKLYDALNITKDGDTISLAIYRKFKCMWRTSLRWLRKIFKK